MVSPASAFGFHQWLNVAIDSKRLEARCSTLSHRLRWCSDHLQQKLPTESWFSSLTSSGTMLKVDRSTVQDFTQKLNLSWPLFEQVLDCWAEPMIEYGSYRVFLVVSRQGSNMLLVLAFSCGFGQSQRARRQTWTVNEVCSGLYCFLLIHLYQRCKNILPVPAWTAVTKDSWKVPRGGPQQLLNSILFSSIERTAQS